MGFNRRALALAPLALLGQSLDSVRAQEVPERDHWPTDAWQNAEAADVGMSADLLDEAERQFDRDLPNHSALVVVRQGRIVRDRTFHGYRADGPINVRSITKSVTGACIGRAIDEGLITSIDQPIGELIGDRIPDDADPRTPFITVRHLLTMTSGWAWDIYSDYPTIIAAENWVDLTLSLPVIYEPGTYYAYNTGGSHLLSVIIQDVSGQLTENFADQRFFEPMGIDKPDWQRSPQGETVGGFGLELTPQQMAKFGFLALNEGRWDGEELVNADYMRQSLSYQSAGDSTGLANYGFQWWVTTTYNAGLPAAFALGYGGQFVYLVPSLDLIVVAAAQRRVPPEELRSPRPIIESLIIPAVIA